MDSKVYVDVEATFTKDGALFHKRFRWEDRQIYEIDKVTDCRRVASLKAGGVGERYTCIVAGTQHYLYYEGDNRWFMERAMQS